MSDDFGVTIDSGPMDWQIFQQDRNGEATIRLKGRWRTNLVQKRVVVFARLVREEGYEAVSAGLDWRRARTTQDGRRGTWSVTLKHVPRGGLYRLETTAQRNDEPIEWGLRGDMRHHLGVGDVWVITGQSNAAGYGKVPVEDAPELGIHMFHADGAWKLATHPLGDSTGSRYTPNREGGNASHSPWLAFARRVKHACGCPVGLIPASRGGSAMAEWDRKSEGELFTNMLAYIRDCGSRVRGALWYQGESDTAPENRALYKKRFRRFVADLRREMKDPRLPVITVQLNRYVGPDVATGRHRDWEAMREIQRQLSHEVDGVHVFSVCDSGLADLIHNDSRGNMLIGERAARTALGAVYGHDIKWRHPECTQAVRKGKQTLELTFANVTGRLHFESHILEEFPFAVRDGEGDVPVAGYMLPSANRFRIELVRPLVGDATVTGIPSANPPPVIPSDVPGHRPILGFTITIE